MRGSRIGDQRELGPTWGRTSYSVVLALSHCDDLACVPSPGCGSTNLQESLVLVSSSFVSSPMSPESHGNRISKEKHKNRAKLTKRALENGLRRVKKVKSKPKVNKKSKLNQVKVNPGKWNWKEH
ncbi:hypothetical protein Tco_0046727 [Tanacetum coccineum]